ncbi:dTDP-glucose 4,6-dehydratase [Dehalobacter sp. DCM]|uniref:dTDP-glucose 4,6-dehydratase n=1 Tax=Dehalobacter sp. DCM TaxID=2907827 RepID=UPI003081BE6D|nr:dTDP-glucose 4,6-dehydratase [Dehalobacter sp. DCM]
MRVILVTGGAGFIGCNFIKYFLEADNEAIIINYDKLTYAGDYTHIKDLEGHGRYYFVRGDIATSQVKKIIRECDPDYVVNFAAESHVDRSISDPMIFGQSNIMGTLNLLECLREFWSIEGKGTIPREKRFLQISTDEVYGSLCFADDPVTEESHIQPNSPYSASKAAADLLVRAYARTYQFPVLITRCCNNYGPYQNEEKFIPACIKRALNNEPLAIYGDGSNIREWIHVRDHCTAIAKVLFSGELGEVYNVGSGEEVSNSAMAAMILRQLGKPEDAVIKVADRPGHDWRYALNSNKVKTKLGWECQYGLEEGIRDTVQWYRENQ